MTLQNQCVTSHKGKNPTLDIPYTYNVIDRIERGFHMFKETISPHIKAS